MSRPTSHLGAAFLIGAFFIPAGADAHGVVGGRFFPATISSDDPFAADELALPTITAFNHETDYDFDYSKSIFPGFAIGIGVGYIDATPPGDPAATGFSNLHIAPTLELFRNPEHEFIMSAGLDWEIGGSGSMSVADRSSTYTPTIKFGKGFGDLPDGIGYLRPLALTATVGYAIPGTISKSIEWAGALEYSLLYLQNNVRDQGFSAFVTRLTPVIEFSFSSPLDPGGGGTTGTVNPGLIWSGQHEQFALEAIIPVNHATGDTVGVIAQLHFYIDDLFPTTLGTPIFGGKR
ncbi:MAG TPA: hypothetical protein VEM35_09860 [Rhizomicrobium sp.]|nr:hypothetical protein [Rhizomicrobium sp.]